MTIARHWTGLAKKDKAQDYINHLRHDTFKKLGSIEGFINASILQRETEEGVEFVVLTEWKSIEAIKKFAGENFGTAVVPHVAQEMMVRFDDQVKHYEITFTT
jgi:hypothetical protein